MFLKVAVAVVLGSIGLIVLRQAVEANDQEQAQLEQAVAAQLQGLRDHLFRR